MTHGGRSDGPDGHGDKDPLYDVRILDPGYRDRGYWARFRASVMTRAANELARRRGMSEVSLLELVQSWARVLLPATAVATVVGAVLLAQSRQADIPAPADPEEVLTEGLEDRTLPDFMALEEADVDEGGFLLAAGSY